MSAPGVMINGLHVVDTGGNGLPVIFQHGLGGDRFQVAENFPDGLATRRITVECRGHGFSPAVPADRFSIAGFADDILAVADHLRIRQFVLGGISMGAAISLRIATQHPDRVKALILARPAWVTDAAPENMRPFADVAALLANHEPQEARAIFAASPLGTSLAKTAPDNFATMTGFFDRPDPALTSALLAAIAADGPGVSRDAVAALHLPTLTIGHAIDYVHPLGFAVELAHLIPGARFVEIPPKATEKLKHVAAMRVALHSFLSTLTPKPRT